MKTIYLAFLLVIINIYANDDLKYYGTVSTEAILEFEGKIDIFNKQNLTVSQAQNSQWVQSKIDNQLQHLIGHFHSNSFLEEFNTPAVLGDSYQVKIKSIKPLLNNRYIISYKFYGKINIHKNAFKSSKLADLEIRLPLDPENIYQLSLQGDINFCTDLHYNSQDDFFYFWDPKAPKCNLKNNKKDVLYILGKIEKLNNTKNTYPEFDRLYNKDKLEVWVFFGFINDEVSSSSIYYDSGYLTFKEIEKELTVDKNFKIIEQSKKFATYDNDTNYQGLSYHTKVSKHIRNQLGKKQEVVINLVLADSSVGVDDQTFYLKYKKALANGDLVAYDGHSGLGANLSFDFLPDLKLSNNYQILFLNGCSSYPYFNSQYFDNKFNGTMNLEIITSGLPTLTSTSYSNMMAFLNPFISGKFISYQSLMDDIEDSNQGEDTYLMGVNGDEDNSFIPKLN